jgi:hypothetical protein
MTLASPPPMRTAALLVAAAAIAALPLQAGAQSGLRVGSRAVDNAVQAAGTQASDVRIALTPVGGQGFTFMPQGWSGAGFRLPAVAMAGTPARYGLTPETGASVDVQVNRWTVSSSVRQGLSPMRQDGSRLDFGASYGVPVASQHEFVVSGGLGFGAGAAGLAPTAGQEVAPSDAMLPLSSGTGLRDVGLRLSWRYSLDRNLFVNTSVGVDRLFSDPTGLGGAYDRNVNSVGAVFGYRFY